ncbi:polyphenol oxidase family protein [Arthrobacter sp. ISL-28]|uniref:polyphenol oxidase family protein n=1 Tax=Arthrobacter sp. ISL-28 TaxID=2819108 RepID=UPI001BE93B43|nr:polyphenol oxidase family protein [Arthrobacter sp. ISL-28]MBT2521658.1 laccase domain-containing protein [Arthrobacter sp. ISL-28]
MFVWRAEVLPGVSVAFTDSAAGNLALHVGDDGRSVMRRREELEAAAGIAPRRFQYMNQVHGNHVAVMESGGPAPTADAMVSRGLPLAVMVADCIPLVLVGDGSAGPVLGVVHAGRPGLASGVIPAALDQLRTAGATEIRAWLGPSICGRCYEVPADLRADVAAVVPSAWSTTSWGTPALDLPAGAASQLESEGVLIEYRGPCTLETDALYSYRRDRQSGRFAGLAWTHE